MGTDAGDPGFLHPQEHGSRDDRMGPLPVARAVATA